ncbi:MAG: putative sugar O-methyltransferase [Alphaproteobacteria bacterium]|jgi:putative sugar O-methyltransferase|nr:putative sugar O-methyltransferase [Alphaproteobacteria bacterium]|tara:strand:+ start:1123 stop:3453 length:2331 start_codon:yes stop_codon:yes gene_type:complete
MSKKEIIDQKTLHHQVVENFTSCFQDGCSMNDIWSHALSERGLDFSLEELQNFLMLGNRANSWTRNLYFFVDKTIIDSTDPITRRLLEIGQPDIGSPFRDIEISGRRYSGLFLHFVALAAEVIRHLEAKGITHPRTLEIGGGFGIFTGLLKAYYGERISTFCVELPGNLLLQEWYLRNVFPGAPTCFKGADDHVEYLDGGMNFINANVYETQDFSFDVALNVISMCEMPTEVANRYIKFVEKNISKDGFFFFANSQGRTKNTVQDVPEYNFDEYWTVSDATLYCPLEAQLTHELMGIVLQRSTRPQNLEARRFLLRFINNALYSGAVFRDRRKLAELLALSTEVSPEQIFKEACRKAWGNESAGEGGVFEVLIEKPYLPEEAFTKPWSREKAGCNGSAKTTDLFIWETGNFCRRLVSEMRKCSDMGASAEEAAARESMVAVTGDFLNAIRGRQIPEYWTAVFSSFLLPLGRGDEARDILLATGGESSHAIWLSRYAQQLCNYGFTDDAASLLERAWEVEERPWFTELNLAVTEHLIGQRERPLKILERSARISHSDAVRAEVVAKACLRIGAIDLFRSFYREIDEEKTGMWNMLFESAIYAESHMPNDIFVSLVENLSSRIKAPLADMQLEQKYGALLIKAGWKKEGYVLLRPIIEGIWDKYYPLAASGKLLRWCGREEWADACLERSLQLRPGNYPHLHFMGNVRMEEGKWERAAELFGKAAIAQPNLLGLWGREAFCRLPEAIRGKKVFGAIAEQDMIFIQEQNHYHDINPRYK